jgi:hypothetical protein
MRFSSVLIAPIAASVLLTACERDPDSLRAQLTAKQASWEGRISSLRALQTTMQERFERQPRPAVAAAGGVSAPHQRVRAILDGSRQSLADIHLQIRDVGSRLEPDLVRGGDAADKALETETARIGTLLQQMSGQLASVGQELDGLASKGESK